MKAYMVCCTNDEHGCEIEFAARGKDVDRRANAVVCDCEWTELRVRRAPNFDKYAPGPVTTRQRLDEGHCYQCPNCEKQVFADEPPVLTDDENAFCSVACVEALLADYRKHLPGAHNSILHAVESMERYLAESRPC